MPDTSRVDVEPDAFVTIWAIDRTDTTTPIAQGLPVTSVATVHAGPHTKDVHVSYAFTLTQEQVDLLPPGFLGMVAYQFFMNPAHPLYTLFDGYEWIGPLPDSVKKDVALRSFTFRFERTFALQLPVAAQNPPRRDWWSLLD